MTVVSSGGTSATLVKRDSATQGNWIGAYGSQGYNIIGSSSQLPLLRHRHAVAGQTSYHLGLHHDRPACPPATSAAPAASPLAGTPDTSFTVNVNLTDGQAHDIAIYALDWPDFGRSEKIQVFSAATGAVLDTETISNFYGGLYLQWNITGNVVIQFSGMGGNNAVLSGLFFDPASASASATLARQDSATQGNWIGAYGSQGYNIIGSSSSYPSYATVSVAGQTSTTWASPTTDPRLSSH